VVVTTAELEAIREIVRSALAEDIGAGDVTSEWTLPSGMSVTGRVVAKGSGIAAGLQVAAEVFASLDPTVEFAMRVEDGQEVSVGDLLSDVTGPARSILAGERVALNFLQRMSGIATLTRRYVDAVAGTRAAILDTRKTAPGLRVIDKLAVRFGGGQNHRMGLFDMILIKDNHITAAGGLTSAVRKAVARNKLGLALEVEVKTLAELREALELPVDRIMLDNMDYDQMHRAVEITNGRVPLEASGGIDLQRVREVAKTGVDYISVGALTHSVTALDMSLEIEPVVMGSLETYRSLSGEQAGQRIMRAKSGLGSALVILGHHYQQDSVIQFADHRGDSLELSRIAAEARDAKYIVFCGVDFMAETAAILCEPSQAVCLPARSAVCPMAQMATAEQAQVAWRTLASMWGDDLIPITYQNSYASLKAFCGQKGGAVCTSSNAQALFRWALGAKGHLLFFPDEHLGRNTANALGIPRRQVALWDPGDPEASGIAAAEATVVVWKGYCHVHSFFTVGHIEQVRRRHPGITVIVHPECRQEVVAQSDLSGSTSFIVRTVEQAPAGACFAVGTECNLVYRLDREHPDKTIVPLSTSFCGGMAKITAQNVSFTLDHLLAHDPVNVVRIDPEVASWAKVALEKMLHAK